MQFVMDLSILQEHQDPRLEDAEFSVQTDAVLYTSLPERSNNSRSGDVPSGTRIRSREDDSGEGDSRGSRESGRRGAGNPPARRVRRDTTQRGLTEVDALTITSLSSVPIRCLGPSREPVRLSATNLLADLSRHVKQSVSELPPGSADAKRARIILAELEVISRMCSPAMPIEHLEASVYAYPVHDNWTKQDWLHFLRFNGPTHGIYYCEEFKSIVVKQPDGRRVQPLARNTYLEVSESISRWIQRMNLQRVDPIFGTAGFQLMANREPFEGLMAAFGKDENESGLFPRAIFRRGIYSWGANVAGGVDLSILGELPFRKSFLSTLDIWDDDGSVRNVPLLVESVAKRFRELAEETNYFTWTGPKTTSEGTEFAACNCLEGNPDEFKEYFEAFIADILKETPRQHVGDAASIVPQNRSTLDGVSTAVRANYDRQPHELLIDMLFRKQGYNAQDTTLFWYLMGMSILENGFDPEDDDVDWDRLARRLNLRPMLFFFGNSGSGKSTMIEAISWLLVQPPMPMKTNAADTFVTTLLARAASLYLLEDAGGKNSKDMGEFLNIFLDFLCNAIIRIRRMRTDTDSANTSVRNREPHEQPRPCVVGSANTYRPTQEEHLRRMVAFFFGNVSGRRDPNLGQKIRKESYKNLIKASFWYVVCRIRYDRSVDPRQWWSAEGKQHLSTWVAGSSVLDRFIRDALLRKPGCVIKMDARFFERLNSWRASVDDRNVQNAWVPTTAVDFQRRMQSLEYNSTTDAAGNLSVGIVGYEWNEALFYKTGGSAGFPRREYPEPTFANVPPTAASGDVLRDEHGNVVTHLEPTVLLGWP